MPGWFPGQCGMKRFEESQKQAASATVIQTQAVVKHAQGHVSLAEDVERARLRMVCRKWSSSVGALWVTVTANFEQVVV